MHLATLYILANNKHLHATTGLTKHELVVLHVITSFNCPLSYTALYERITELYGMISYKTYQRCVDNLTAMNAFQSCKIGHSTIFSITITGKSLLAQYNTQLDLIVSDQIKKYGNGFSAE